MATRRRFWLIAPLAAAVAAFAQAPSRDIERMSRADLEQLPGVGIAMAERVLQERERRPFADWSDLMRRVPGLKRRLAARLSAEGLRVQGLPFDGPPQAPRPAQARQAIETR